jgi:DNA polymerase III epsilon subunit-like protein
MKYLFFDIECASVFKTTAKICAFGYCLTDEQFHIIEQEDVLVNPQGGFHLTDRKGSQGLVLPYEYKDFKNYPTFPALAPRIYALLEDKDTVVAGHATMNDVKYLNLESKRFSLPSFCFDFADTQFIYMNKIGVFNRQFGLGSIAEAMGVEFTHHRAVDDAYATMKVAESMCKEEGTDFLGLLKKYEIRMGRIENYEVRQNESRAHEEYVQEAQRRKELREQIRIEFHNFIDREKKKRKKEGILKNKTVCFSHSLEENLPLSKSLAAAIFAQGGSYSCRAEECDYYVALEGESGLRIKTALSNGAKLLTVEEFSLFLGKPLIQG